ncbi:MULTISPECIES: hypothetical protein [unclassified Bradyrhizobium]|uniref:hypothetical protein n=1 Tax=unclassified Bradyrhizobium TaxID=2631580 RepID=UPI0015CADB94|nr:MULTISPECIES: hypothetical protein [unclassified Bradyrhizobium]MBB4258653.1 hypothetical protein [Bradyrhizobium sp. CIR3A]MBB4423141.1 hypothetical protein [Bradyrhizobium sp. CIR48]NYG47002.1 hypothetical protein [Bradyrhizobium sp. IAR9]
MTLRPELVPARIDWHVFAVMSNTMPPRDPDDDEEDDDEDDEDEEQDEEENQTDESPVVREPDED